jgi:hypothetical protein
MACVEWRKRPQKRPTHLLDLADNGCQLERAFREYEVNGNALQDDAKQVALKVFVYAKEKNVF